MARQKIESGQFFRDEQFFDRLTRRLLWYRVQLFETYELPQYCFDCGNIHPTIVKLWLN